MSAPGPGEREGLAEAVRRVYERHDPQAPLNHVNVAEWCDELEPLLAQARQEAWDNGYAAGYGDRASPLGNVTETTNPYRAAGRTHPQTAGVGGTASAQGPSSATPAPAPRSIRAAGGTP